MVANHILRSVHAGTSIWSYPAPLWLINLTEFGKWEINSASNLPVICQLAYGWCNWRGVGSYICRIVRSRDGHNIVIFAFGAILDKLFACTFYDLLRLLLE